MTPSTIEFMGDLVLWIKLNKWKMGSTTKMQDFDILIDLMYAQVSRRVLSPANKLIHFRSLVFG